MSLLVRLASSSLLVFCLGLLLKTTDSVIGQGCNCLRVEDCDLEQKLCYGKCAYGYLNPPLCLDACPPNMYGLDCMMTCHCPDDDTCENVQGVCSSLRCHPDWAGAGCSKRLPKLHSPPRVVSSSCTAVRLRWHKWEPSLDYGDYPVLEYRLYMMTRGREGWGTWEEATRRQQQVGVAAHTADVPLPPSPHPRAYKFRVDAFYDDFGKLSVRASPGIETDFIVPCTANESTDPSQGVFEGKVIQNVHHNVLNAREVEVTWSVSDPSLLASLHITYSYQLAQVGDCPPPQQDKGGGHVVELKGNRSSLMLHNLEPWRTYRFKLRAASPSLPEEGEVTQGTFSTSSESPTGPVQKLTIFNISSTSASASWLKPSCPTRGGALVYFELELREVDNIFSLPFVFYSSSQEVTIYNLLPATRYCLRVRYVNPAGPGPFSECTNLTTSAASQMRAFIVDGRGRFPRSLPPRPSNLRQSSASIECVGMSWDSPVTGLISAPIQGFRIFDLTGQTYSPGMEPLPLAPGPTARTAMVCGLRAGQSYVLGLSSRSLTGDDSIPITAVFTTDHDKPEKPFPPRVVSRGLTNVVITIKPVSSIRGPVTAYDIYVAVAELSEQEKVDAGFPRSPRGIVEGEEEGMYYVRRNRPGSEQKAITPDIQSNTFPRQGALIEVDRSRGNTSTLTRGHLLPTAAKLVPVGNMTASPQGGMAYQQNGTANVQNGTARVAIETKNLRSGMESPLNGSSNREQSIVGKNVTDILDEAGKEGLSTLPFLIEKGRPDVQKWGVRIKPEEFATQAGLPSTTLAGFKPPANDSATVSSPNAATLVSGVAKNSLPGILEMGGSLTSQDEHSSSSGKSNILEGETSPAKTRSGRTSVMQSPSTSPVSPVQVRSISFSLRGERQRQVSPPSSTRSLLRPTNPAVTEITEKGAALSSGDQGAGAAATEENGGVALERFTKGVTSPQLSDPTTTQISLLNATRGSNDTDTKAEADKDIVMNRKVTRRWSHDPYRSRREVSQNPPPGRIQARLGPERIKGESIFVIGDDAVYGGYKNTALKPDGRYNVYLVANSFWNGANKFASSDPVTILMPREVTVFHVYARNARFVSAVVIIFFVVTALLTALTASLWDGCIRWQHRRRRLTELHEPEMKYVYGSSPSRASANVSPVSFRSHLSGIELLPAADERNWSESYSLSQRRHIVTGRNLLPPEQLIELPAQEMLGRGEKVTFRREFQSLPRPHPSASMNVGQQHFDRNLTPGILPFDATRCVLQHDSTGHRNYINASNIRGIMSEDRMWGNYIVAQSPFDEGSAVDLWRLIYQQNVTTVVVLSRTIEDGTRKCHQYWPDIGKVKVGPFKISLVDQFPFADFTERLFSVQRRRLRNKRGLQVRHFTFLGWPEKGVPSNPIPLLELRDRVRQTYTPTMGPVLVHCDTGSGRSAVFVALDMLLATYASNGEISVFSTVSALRAERPYMIQTFQQYTFLYDAVFEHQHAGNTVMGDNFRECYQKLSRRNPVTGRSYLRDQFLLLRLVSAHDLQCKDGRNVPDLIPPARSHNRTSNRFDLDLEELEEWPEESVGARRGAFFVDSYRRRHHYVLSPTPTPYGVCHFWQLVYDNNITTIIMLDDDVTLSASNSRRQQGLYWPMSGSLQWEPFIVELVGSNSQNGILTRTLTLIHKYHGQEDPRCIRQFHFHNWGHVTGFLHPHSRKSSERNDTRAASQHGRQQMLQMLHLVKMWQDQCSLDSTPVLLHCADGISGSGLVVALALVISRLEEDGYVSVYRQVRKLHKCCSNIMGIFEQYKFLYKCLWDYTYMHKPGGVFSYGVNIPRYSYPQEQYAFGERRQTYAGPDQQDIYNNLDQDSSSSSSSSTDDRSPTTSPQRLHVKQWSPSHSRSFSYPRHLSSQGSPRYLRPTLGLLSPRSISVKPDFSVSDSSGSTDDESLEPRTMGRTSTFLRQNTDPRLSRQTHRSSPSLVRRHLSWSPARENVPKRSTFSAPERRSRLSPGYRYSMHGIMATTDNVRKMAVSREAENFRFKQHSLYPDLRTHTGVVQQSAASASYISSLSTSHLSSGGGGGGGGGILKRSPVWSTSGSPSRRNMAKLPSPRNLSALSPRRSFPTLSSPHRRLPSPRSNFQLSKRQSPARQRFAVTRLDKLPSPSRPRTSPRLGEWDAAEVSPQTSESHVKKVTELLDDDGVFYHKEVTDTVVNFSSTSDDS